MNSLTTTIIAWLLFLSAQPQKTSAIWGRQRLFEKQSVSEVQWMSASELDTELPRKPFVEWFAKVVGPGVGVAWQLCDCADFRLESPDDIAACVEASAILPDSRPVFLRITVGTFKQGRIGAPKFCFGAVEWNRELHLVSRMRDLPKLLWTPGSLSPQPAIKLPEAWQSKLVVNNAYVAEAEWRGEEPGMLMTIDDTPPPPPVAPPSNTTSSTANNQSVSGVIQGSVITRAKPIYPQNARKFNTSGPVEVRVIVSATGRVTNAEAISGHPLLRAAAMAAARKWVFKPTVVNGVPIETQLILTFDFTP